MQDPDRRTAFGLGEELVQGPPGVIGRSRLVDVVEKVHRHHPLLPRLDAFVFLHYVLDRLLQGDVDGREFVGRKGEIHRQLQGERALPAAGLAADNYIPRSGSAIAAGI